MPHSAMAVSLLLPGGVPCPRGIASQTAAKIDQSCDSCSVCGVESTRARVGAPHRRLGRLRRPSARPATSEVRRTLLQPGPRRSLPGATVDHMAPHASPSTQPWAQVVSGRARMRLIPTCCRMAAGYPNSACRAPTTFPPPFRQARRPTEPCEAAAAFEARWLLLQEQGSCSVSLWPLHTRVCRLRCDRKRTMPCAL